MTEKSIYIRAGLLPEDRYPVRDICRNNRIGNNVGNLLYLYSILRFLRADGRKSLLTVIVRRTALSEMLILIGSTGR